MLHCQPQPGSRHLGIFSACQGSSRQPHQQQQDTAHSSTLAPAHRLLSPPPSPPGTCSQPLQVVTGHPCPAQAALARPSTALPPLAAASTAPLLVAAHCSLPRLLAGARPHLHLAVCTVHPRCRDCAVLCKIRLSCAVLGCLVTPHSAAHSRAAVIIPPTPGPHFYTSQHRDISHSALWHYSTA